MRFHSVSTKLWLLNIAEQGITIAKQGKGKIIFNGTREHIPLYKANY